MIVTIMIGITGLLIVAARATLVTWITVLVLLAFVAGKRRKSLVREGRKITTDITVYAMKNILLKDKSIIAITFRDFELHCFDSKKSITTGETILDVEI